MNHSYRRLLEQTPAVENDLFTNGRFLDGALGGLIPKAGGALLAAGAHLICDNCGGRWVLPIKRPENEISGQSTVAKRGGDDAGVVSAFRGKFLLGYF